MKIFCDKLFFVFHLPQFDYYSYVYPLIHITLNHCHLWCRSKTLKYFDESIMKYYFIYMRKHTTKQQAYRPTDAGEGIISAGGGNKLREKNLPMITSSNGNIFRVTGHLCGEFNSQRPVTRSFDAFFDLRLNKRLSKQSWGWWFETPSYSLWRHCNDYWLNWWRM